MLFHFPVYMQPVEIIASLFHLAFFEFPISQ